VVTNNIRDYQLGKKKSGVTRNLGAKIQKIRRTLRHKVKAAKSRNKAERQSFGFKKKIAGSSKSPIWRKPGKSGLGERVLRQSQNLVRMRKQGGRKRSTAWGKKCQRQAILFETKAKGDKKGQGEKKRLDGLDWKNIGGGKGT